MVEFRIIVGHTFSSEEFHKIKNSEKMSLYYNKVLHYIDFKPRSKKEVYNYLLNLDVDEKSINEIIQKLIKIQYLDDERYAQSYILELIRKSKGRLYILQNLLLLFPVQTVWLMVSGQRLFQSHLNRRGSRHLQQILLHQEIQLQYRRNPVNGLLEEVHIQPYSRYHTDRRGHRNKAVDIC